MSSRSVPCLAAAVAFAMSGCASHGASPRFDRAEVRIPMRDGVTLFAVTLRPHGNRAPLPIILVRTPFDATAEFPGATLPPMYRALAQDGYIFVVEDVRGRFHSGGTFVVNRPLADSGGVDESTDAWDTIDWLIHHLPGNNGKVGVMGSSYRGWLAAMTGIHAHPALKAISPEAPTADTWIGDDFFHQGAFRETQGVVFASYIEGSGNPPIPDNDQYDFYLHQGTLSAIARAAGVSQLPFWRDLAAHPAYDTFWQSRALQGVDAHPEVPTLIVGGWWDQEDIFGPQALYRAAVVNDSDNEVHLVLGPWSHNQWLGPRADSVGPIALDTNTATWFREHLLRPWFAWYLHGIGDGHFARATVFETGENRWHTFDAWPPAGTRSRNLYLGPGGTLSFDSLPAMIPGDSGFTSYRSDPAAPVPFLPAAEDGTGWQTWLTHDQRFNSGRADVARWESKPLDGDVVIAGDVMAHLFASTTGSDADWVVKVIDVFPGPSDAAPGYELMISADIMRGRYWKGFDHPTALSANRVTPFDIDLHQQFYRVKQGHRIMIEVQSSWFPLYDRNPQTFVANIFDATPADYQSAMEKIWRVPGAASHITLTVAP